MDGASETSKSPSLISGGGLFKKLEPTAQLSPWKAKAEKEKKPRQKTLYND